MSRYVVIDLEMCRVSRGMKKMYGRSNETIQIGAVLMNDRYEIEDEFMTYVHPQYGKIDSFIRNLTGITEDKVSGAPDMVTAINSFLDWIPEGDIKAVSWSMTDERQMEHEADAYSINSEKLDFLFENWIDSQKIFGDKMGFDHACSLEEALIATDVFTDGRAHDGLVDAMNTALLFAKMKKEPVLKLNSYYQKAKDAKPENFSCSFGDIMESFGIMATA